MSRFLFLILVLALVIVELNASYKGRRRSPKKSPSKAQPSSDKVLHLKLSKYRIVVEAGNPPQKLEFDINTMTPHTSISVTGCAVPNILGDRCSPSRYAYNPDSSKTARFDSKDAGNCTDDLKLVEAKKNLQKFEFSVSVCNDVSTWSSGCKSGAIGLGPQTLTSEYSFVKQAMKSGLFSKALASVHFKRCPQTDKDYELCPGEGNVVFGGLDAQNCAKDGQTLSVKNDASEWSFQITDYKFIVQNGSETKSTSGNPQTFYDLKASFTTVSPVLRLPTQIYRDLADLSGVWWDKPYFVIPCDRKLQLKFSLKDNQGKAAEITLTQDDLFVEKIDGRCRMGLKGMSEWDHDKQRNIVIGQAFYKAACVVHDFEKKTLTLSRPLK